MSKKKSASLSSSGEEVKSPHEKEDSPLRLRKVSVAKLFEKLASQGAIPDA